MRSSLGFTSEKSEKSKVKPSSIYGSTGITPPGQKSTRTPSTPSSSTSRMDWIDLHATTMLLPSPSSQSMDACCSPSGCCASTCECLGKTCTDCTRCCSWGCNELLNCIANCLPNCSDCQCDCSGCDLNC